LDFVAEFASSLAGHGRVATGHRGKERGVRCDQGRARSTCCACSESAGRWVGAIVVCILQQAVTALGVGALVVCVATACCDKRCVGVGAKACVACGWVDVLLFTYAQGGGRWRWPGTRVHSEALEGGSAMWLCARPALCVAGCVLRVLHCAPCVLCRVALCALHSTCSCACVSVLLVHVAVLVSLWAPDVFRYAFSANLK
jgi:hypothetical protein